jgi:hypothetical protein
MIPKFAKSLARKLPSAIAVREMVVIPPVHHFVRGFMLERTLEKRVVYLWRMVVPLFRPMDNVTLNYSDRVASAEGIVMRINLGCDIDILAESTSEFLKQSYLPELLRVESSLDFLNKFELGADQRRPNIVLELAIAHCLAGHCDLGRGKLVELIQMESDSPVLSINQGYASEVLEALNRSNEDFFKKIAEFEQRNLDGCFRGVEALLCK